MLAKVAIIHHMFVVQYENDNNALPYLCCSVARDTIYEPLLIMFMTIMTQHTVLTIVLNV